MDIALYYQEKGKKEPFILLHGNGEDGSYFKHQIDYFSDRYRVIALDTRGHGRSPRGSKPFTIGSHFGVFGRSEHSHEICHEISGQGKGIDIEWGKSEPGRGKDDDAAAD